MLRAVTDNQPHQPSPFALSVQQAESSLPAVTPCTSAARVVSERAKADAAAFERIIRGESTIRDDEEKRQRRCHAAVAGSPTNPRNRCSQSRTALRLFPHRV
jgi:hypothetical protein